MIDLQPLRECIIEVLLHIKHVLDRTWYEFELRGKQCFQKTYNELNGNNNN